MIHHLKQGVYHGVTLLAERVASPSVSWSEKKGTGPNGLAHEEVRVREQRAMPSPEVSQPPQERPLDADNEGRQSPLLATVSGGRNSAAALADEACAHPADDELGRRRYLSCWVVLDAQISTTGSFASVQRRTPYRRITEEGYPPRFVASGIRYPEDGPSHGVQLVSLSAGDSPRDALWTSTEALGIDAALCQTQPERMLGEFALSFWLEGNAIPVLHASAVVGPSGACILFIANSGAGKSTLAAYLCQRLGFHLVADDVVAIHGGPSRATADNRATAIQRPGSGFWVYPGVRKSRLCRDAAKHLAIDASTWRDLPGTISKVELSEPPNGGNRRHPLSVSAVCFLSRHRAKGAPTAVERLPPSVALGSLLQHGATAGFPAHCGRDASRLHSLAQFAKEVPMFHVKAANNLDDIPHTWDAIQAHFAF